MQKHKGTAYDPSAVVAEAVQKTGWTPEKFFANAKLFARTNGFDSQIAAQAFAAAQAKTTTGSVEIPKPVVVFADWVLVTSLPGVEEKISNLAHARRSH